VTLQKGRSGPLGKSIATGMATAVATMRIKGVVRAGLGPDQENDHCRRDCSD